MEISRAERSVGFTGAVSGTPKRKWSVLPFLAMAKNQEMETSNFEPGCRKFKELFCHFTLATEPLLAEKLVGMRTQILEIGALMRPCYNLGIAKLSADSKKDTKESKNMTCSAPVTLQQLKSFRLVPRSLKSPTPMRCGAVGISRSHPSPALRRSTSALSRATWRSTANEQRVVDPTGWNPKTWVHTVYTQL